MKLSIWVLCILILFSLFAEVHGGGMGMMGMMGKGGDDDDDDDNHSGKGGKGGNDDDDDDEDEVDEMDDVDEVDEVDEMDDDAAAEDAADPVMSSAVCGSNDLEWNMATQAVLATVLGSDRILGGLVQYQDEGITVGSTTALIPEAADASVTGAPVEDGESGDIDFPFGNMKPIATVGERSACDESLGQKICGVPDGLGAYLADDETIRVVVQCESYGTVSQFETFPFFVNDGSASFTGSHVQYVDYMRDSFKGFMAGDYPASDMVTGMGNMIETAYNLKGELVGPRNPDGPTTMGTHYANTDAEGNYVLQTPPSEADWIMQSLCSAHLEERHQWGEGIGVEDDLFITNEEWINYVGNTSFVGIGAHVIDIHERTSYALGAFTNSGFEKIVEINPQHPDYVMFAVSGYNGDYSGVEKVLEDRRATFGLRPDGQEYVWTENICPFRIYIGIKGLMEDGSEAPEDDFPARNGLRYGRVYGYAIDMSESGPSGGVWRDEFHRDPSAAFNGASVPGMWIAIDWQWDGVVQNYEYDGAWEFQLKPPGTGEGSGYEAYQWWNANGLDDSGFKTEHGSPDPRDGISGFVQGSTAGYFGHLYVNEVMETLDSLDAAAGELPDMMGGSYYVYQGELDVTSQIDLGGKGQYPDGRDATLNWDDAEGDGKVTFEDIDGLELFESPDGVLHVILQEDSGNDYGERMFISGPLEHDNDGMELSYYFVAMSGGVLNTRMAAGVGIPRGTSCRASSHEFSGLFDLSAFLVVDDDGEFMLSADQAGSSKRMMDRSVMINDKTILVGLQSHNLACGIISTFQADRGGQWLVYNPMIPMS